jgi:hypothetical protein
MATHWYVAKLFFGTTPAFVMGADGKPYTMSGQGESHEDAITDLGLDADNLDHFRELAALQGVELKIVVVDQFRYEKVLYIPGE